MCHFPSTDFNTKKNFQTQAEIGPLPDLVLKLALLNAVLHFHLRTFKLYFAAQSLFFATDPKGGRISLRFSGLTTLDIWKISGIAIRGLIIQICEVANLRNFRICG
jgi:hypothetical protein